MRIKETKLYTYAELSDDAKAKARDWYREASAGDNFFAESITEDLAEVCTAVGWDLNTRRGTQSQPAIYWSGFWSQGDGAAFEGGWRASRMDRDKVAAMTLVRPGLEAGNVELVRILHEYLRIGALFPGASGSASNSNRGFFMSTEFDPCCDHDDEVAEEHGDDTAEEFQEAARDLAAWFYRALETEWEYQNSDECVAETIEANEYEFTEDGNIA